jgi:hypothetical protein
VRLVLVEWVDSYRSLASWMDLEDFPDRPLTCRSVGWLLRDTAECKVIIPHLTADHEDVQKQGCGDMTIPTQAVLKIVDLCPQGAPSRRKKTAVSE